MAEPGRYQESVRRGRALPDHDPREPTVGCRSNVEGEGPLEPEPARSLSWLAVRVEDPDGTGLPEERVRVELDGGRVLTGTTGPDGSVRFDEVEQDRGVASLETEDDQ
ncbi:MAG: hypothetical protein AB7R55_15650 [Gemmatimonadales bacterium]